MDTEIFLVVTCHVNFLVLSIRIPLPSYITHPLNCQALFVYVFSFNILANVF